MTVFVTVKLEIDSNDIRFTKEILNCMNYGFEYLDSYGDNFIVDTEITEQQIVV
jgi:hypothetical protein